MTCTPDRRHRAGQGKAAFAALAGLALLAAPVGLPLAAQGAESVEAALAAGREALLRGDGIAAEIELRRALDGGAPVEAIAARLGEAYLLQGDLYAARDWLGEEQFSPETRRHGYHMLARLEMAEGRFAEAGAAFERALEGNPGTAEIWVDIGRLRYRSGAHHQALEASLAALERDSEDPRALEFRGQLVRDAQGLAAALPWFEKGIAAAPDDLGLLGEYAATLGELGRAHDMLRVTRRMIELDGSNPRAFYLQAVLAARAGNFNLARRLLWRTGDTFRQVPALMLLRGILEIQAGNHSLAVEEFADLVRLKPENPRLQLLFARALLENGDEAELIARFGPLAERPDASAYLLTLVGRAYEITGDRMAAAPYLDRAAASPAPGIRPLAVSEAGALAMFRWGDDPFRLDAAVPTIRSHLAEGRIDDAENAAFRLGERYRGSADVQVLAGDVALARGKAGDALANYTAAAEIRRSFPLVERMVAAHRMLGQDGLARELLAEYLRQHPGEGDAALLLGEMAAGEGDWQRARSYLAHARALRGAHARDPLLLASLARAGSETGDTQAALELARAAYRMQRANGRVAQALARVLERAGGHEGEVRALQAKLVRLALVRPTPANPD